MDLLFYIAAGATVGLAIGITGVGGGSIMTPLLLAFGFPLNIAVGTDLLYAAITKSGGVIVHAKQKNIQWNLVYLMALGSIPASLLTIYALKYWFESTADYTAIISSVLGFTLILTSAAIIFKSQLSTMATKFSTNHAKPILCLTPVLGFILGVLVTLSSVGAGAIATAILLIFYPHLKSLNIVGTDIAHAVPLTLIAGLGHLTLGNVDFMLLAALIAGSLPAVYVGAKFARFIPERIMRPILATTLFGTGIKVAFF